MKKVLFLTATYLPQPNAVGICVEAIANEFENRGYETFVMTMSNGSEYERIGNCHIYNVPVPKRKQSMVVPIRKLETAFWILRNYPLESYAYRKLFLDKVDTLLLDNEFEMIICAQKPAMTAWFGKEIKRKYPTQRVVLYELDSLTDNDSSYNGWTKYLKNRCYSIEKIVYESVDLILHLDSHREYYEDEQYRKYKEKSKYVGIPLLDRRLFAKVDDNINSEKKTCIYTGMFYPIIREPYYVIELIRALKNQNNVKFDFYTHGEFDAYLKTEAQKSGERIDFCGYIDKEIIDQKYREADYLLNVGNFYSQKTGAVPSKLFSYISTGKPIIHISPNEYDTSLPYLQKYPNVLVLNMNEEFHENVKKLEEFLVDCKQRDSEWFELVARFEENTADYTVNLMIGAL